MENKKIYIGIFVCALLIAVGGFGYYGYKDYWTVAPSGDQPAVDDKDVVEHDIGGGLKIGTVGDGNVEIKREDLGASIPLPNLDRPVIVPASFSEEAKKIITAKILETSTALKKDPTQFGDWLNLGIYRKTIEDYAGARDVWEFLIKTNPQDSIAYSNLANVYGYYLHDVKKAEANYLKAIELKPTQVTFYRGAADFYRDVLKDSAKARAIIQQGIDKNPTTAQDLKAILPMY